MDDGIKTLDLHLRATYRVRSAAYFIAFILGIILLCIPTVSSFKKIIYYLCSSKPIEVRVGLLLKYVLIGCTVTESKCSRIT